jgi:hypothetical protein
MLLVVAWPCSSRSANVSLRNSVVTTPGTTCGTVAASAPPPPPAFEQRALHLERDRRDREALAEATAALAVLLDRVLVALRTR